MSETTNLQTQGLVIVLSGFSGAGKGTIMKHLLAAYPERYCLSVSATTRKRRAGEEDGREYFFKTREEFEQMIAGGELLEYAEFNGNYYGTPKAAVLDCVRRGKDVILEIEVQGALQIRDSFPDALLLFVTPPSADVLKERLVGRGTETPEVIAQRLAISIRESAQMEKYDFLVVNDRLEDAVLSVHQMIASEHLRMSRNQETIDRMRQQLQVFSKGNES